MRASFRIIMLLLAGCRLAPSGMAKVVIAGNLQDIMTKGDLAAHAAVDTIQNEGLYGLGALDSLRGEILIENGRTLVSMKVNDSLWVHSDGHYVASLLVYTHVQHWDTLEVTGCDLELLLSDHAERESIDTPLVFMIQGVFPKLDFHVIRFDPRKSVQSHHQHRAYQGDLAGQPVVILGFYSTQHHGQFTHHGSNVHMHVRNASETAMGHVDKLETGKGSFILLLPKL